MTASALDRLSLTVQAREFLAIVGASAPARTTLLQLINRLSEPSEGRLRVGGADVQSLDPITLRRGIGYVFQEVGLFPHMTVAENIAITPQLLGRDKARMAERAAHSSDGRIDQYGLQVLDDLKQAIPPYDAILLIAPKRIKDTAFLDVLRPLVDAIPVETMRQANRRVSEGASAHDTARWLADKIGR